MENKKNAKEQKTVRTRANRMFFWKVGINAFLMLLGTVLITSLLQKIQRKAADEELEEDCRYALEKTVSILDRDLKEAEELTDGFHRGNQNMLEMLSGLISEGKFSVGDDLAVQYAEQQIRSMPADAGVESLFLLSDDGTVLYSIREGLEGVNLLRSGRMEAEEMEPLLRGTRQADGQIVPVLDENGSDRKYYYSSACTVGGKEYAAVLGADASRLDSQVKSRKDFTALLERSAAWRGGFFFAVHPEDRIFLSYRDRGTVLTGQDAMACGLSEKAFRNGYAGTQLIDGKKIFCMSGRMSDGTLIFAASDVREAYSDHAYVLFWTVTGFVLVLLVCLAYGVIVRNDFVRNSIPTKRKTLKIGSLELILDLSIFRRVFPLMISGVLLIFGISYYTGTLQDISGSIESSVATLEEVIDLHEESVSNQKQIRDNYLSRYLSEARMLGFLLEQDPSFLNAWSDRVYSRLDQDGNRVFLADEEGNRLKSVGRSEQLQEICDRNGFGSISIYNREGHTIATNTDSWYVTLDRDESPRSDAFRQLLDGRTDYCIIEPGDTPEDEAVQYLGVSYYYFTKKDPEGNTVYVPYRDYLESLKEKAPGAEAAVTGHRGLLEIGLNDQISRMLLRTTELVNTFSSNVLSGGFVMMFDRDDGHTCVYSPNEAQIGRPAAELGYSDRAFSGNDYFGFIRLGGETYFQYFRYMNDGYIATAIPKAGMHHYRTEMALVSALSSFLLLLILTCAITLTSQEEERLYAKAAGDARKRLGASIFRIILPSGATATTVKAEARWDGRRLPWSEKPPETKLMNLIGAAGFLMVLNIVISATGAGPWFTEVSLIRGILRGNWERGVNIFALTACMVVIMGALVIVYLLRFPMRILKSLLGARGETVGHLLLSVARYGGLIGSLFYCLYLVGIDSTSLLASAGVLSLVIGFGAQNLIKDILAGIFIVFEGEFRVGDIVTIDDFRGEVLEIGLRTTKILGPGGNTKIFNNSDITGLLNMTQDASVATCQVSIEYGQDIEAVESILLKELPELKKRNRNILEGPEYLGVSSIGDSGVVLLITCKCTEDHIYDVTRFLNREILQIFNRNRISMPFPTVSVSMLDPEPEEKPDPRQEG